MVLARASSRSPREVLTAPADRTGPVLVAVDEEARPRPERHTTDASSHSLRKRHGHVKPTIRIASPARLRAAPEKRGQTRESSPAGRVFRHLPSPGRTCRPPPRRAPLCGILVAVMLHTTNTSTATVRERKTRPIR